VKLNNCRCTILKIQRAFPEAILGGSAALIMQGVLPERDIGDIDFIINKKHINVDRLANIADEYKSVEELKKYASYYTHIDHILVNFLVYDDDVDLEYSTVEIKHRLFFKRQLKLSKPKTIIAWKRKYNRDKDQDDLKIIDKIAQKAIEDELL